MQGKTFYMQLGDGSEFESQKSKTQELVKNAKAEIKDFTIDEMLEQLIGGVEVLDISGGVATIAMPLEMLKVLKMFSKLLENENERGISR